MNKRFLNRNLLENHLIKKEDIMSNIPPVTQKQTAAVATPEVSSASIKASDTDQKVNLISKQKIPTAKTATPSSETAKKEETLASENVLTGKTTGPTLYQKLAAPNTLMPTSEQKELSKKVALGGFVSGVAIAGAGGYKQSSSAVGMGLLAMGLSIVSEYLSQARPEFNYKNPLDLEQAKKSAKSDSFQVTVKKHGWENIRTHKLLSSQEINEKLFHETKNLDLLTIGFLYDLKSSRMYAGFPEKALECLYQAKFISEKKRQASEECCLVTERPLSAEEQRSGRTMESKAKDASLARDSTLNALTEQEERLKGAYLSSLTSSFPKSA